MPVGVPVPERVLADLLLGDARVRVRPSGVQLVQSAEQVGDLRRLVGACVDSWFEEGHPWPGTSLEDGGDLAVGDTELGGHALVAYAPDPVGCVLLHAHSDGCGELSNLFVRREWRRRGVADSLLEAALGTARGVHMSRVDLVVSRRLESAVSLFERWGFTQVPGRQAGVVSMSLALPSSA